MFVRRAKKKLRSGEVRTYLSLAHNVRERLPDGSSRPKPVIFAQLGPEADVDAKTARDMRDALDRYIRKRFGDDAADAETLTEVAVEVGVQAPALRMLASRAFGMRVVVEKVYKDLGLERALKRVAKKHKVDFDFERIVFAMLLNRMVDPVSKRACNEWVRNEAWMPELSDVQTHHFYRALDLMDAHTDDILAAVGKAAQECCSAEELSLLLIDTTTSYQESEYDDDERKQILADWQAYWNGEGDEPTLPPPQTLNDPPLRKRGHSKDHRPREPQVKIGLVTTEQGRVVDVQTQAGNTSDQRMTIDLLSAAAARLPGHRLVAVMDSGMGGGPNLAAIDEMKPAMDRVSAIPLRRSNVADDVLLSQPGRWSKHPYKEGFVVRDIVLDADTSPSGRPERWVATRNQAEARRQKRLIDRELERIKAALAEDNGINHHGRPVCKLLANAKRRRYLKKNKLETAFIIDTDRVRIEKRRAGVHLLRSTLVDEPMVTTLRAYDAQYGIEAQFRALKTPLKLRPMHHRASRRIQAHVLMCALALMVMRELERRTGRTLKDVQRAVGRHRATQVQQGRTRFWQRQDWSDEATEVLRALDIAPGPYTWGAEQVG